MKSKSDFVPETPSGIWFLGSETWVRFVLEVAVEDLFRLIGKHHPPRDGLVRDIGCGQGKSFRLLRQKIKSARLIGIDADPAILDKARRQALRRH